MIDPTDMERLSSSEIEHAAKLVADLHQVEQKLRQLREDVGYYDGRVAEARKKLNDYVASLNSDLGDKQNDRV